MNRNLKLVVTALVGIAIAISLGASSCGTTPQPSSGEDIAKSRDNYVSTNDVEGRNYNARQVIADNPSTLIWCTAFPTNQNAKPFTTPIVGKLTSGNKRPYSTSRTIIDGDTTGLEYSPEVAGPDGMYGSSGEYRYGFDPAGNYHDFYNLETYCTSVPNTFQKNSTEIIVKVSGDLATVDKQVEAALKVCKTKETDPSKSCPEAARLLGD